MHRAHLLHVEQLLVVNHQLVLRHDMHKLLLLHQVLLRHDILLILREHDVVTHLPVQYALCVEHAVVEVIMIKRLRLRLASTLFLALA